MERTPAKSRLDPKSNRDQDLAVGAGRAGLFRVVLGHRVYGRVHLEPSQIIRLSGPRRCRVLSPIRPSAKGS